MRFFCLSVFVASVVSAAADSAVISIDASKSGPAINPRMYGIFLEEINHGVDGGLYAEMIRNRGFEDSRPPEGYVNENGGWKNRKGFDSGFSRYGYSTTGIPFWHLVQSGDAKGGMHLETSGGVTSQSAYCMRLEVKSTSNGRIGVANEGFFGIGIKEGEAYKLSLHARANSTFNGTLTARMEDGNGNACSNEISFSGIPDEWKKFEGTLTGNSTDPKCRLVITARGEGTLWLDFVSLFPSETWKGHANGLRADIAGMIAALKPGFVRFPGGCVVEAGSIETAYDWKLTVGAVEQRQERWGPWNTRRTQGMGLLEYLQFCEDMKAEPLYVGFAGQTCIFRGPEVVPMDQMAPYRDSFLDVIEYANGSPNTEWGKQRTAAGHPAPFNLKYVEIGNENQGPEFGERYKMIHDALEAKHPDLVCFSDLSFTSRESLGGAHFDVEDQHYYNSPAWFASRFGEYDKRSRKLPPLYLGEVAVTTPDAGQQRGNLRAALSEGVFLMGCEKNSDVVKMVSYAPLLGHVEGRTELPGAPPPWHAMIYYDGLKSFGTTSYYLWKLFGENRPDSCVQTEITYPARKPLVLEGPIGVGTWADTAEFKDIRVQQGGATLYQSDFTKQPSGWTPASGQWTTQDGVYRQTRQGQGFSYFGNENWSNYTLSLKARNTGGAEGFIITFGSKGEDKLWWNLGGWGNSAHGVEFNQRAVGPPVAGRIERNRWYDIKVEVSGANIRCYLDGKLIHDVVVEREQKLFSVAGIDSHTNEMVIKTINLGRESLPTELRMTSFTHSSPSVNVTTLSSENLGDNNSLAEPNKVLPRQTSLVSSGENLSYEFPPYSLTIIRISKP